MGLRQSFDGDEFESSPLYQAQDSELGGTPQAAGEGEELRGA